MTTAFSTTGRRHRRSRRLSALWLAVPLVLIVALRGETRDTSVYTDIFRSTTEFPLHPLEHYATTGVEWGFGLLSWVLVSVGLGVTAAFAVVSAATLFFIDRTAARLNLTFYTVMPYYLGSFFLSHQLMQIRQGLGVALAFWLLVGFTLERRRIWRIVVGIGAGSLVHIVSVMPIVSALLLRLWMPASRRRRILIWTVALIAVTALLARVASHLQVFDLFERLSIYAADDEYSAARELFAAANVRAVLVLLLLLLCCKAPALASSRSYVLMLGLYAIHLGFRLGFLDFQILSGRLSTALGFAEVFLLPMAIRAHCRERWLRATIATAYLVVHATAMLAVQAPFLLDDYFTPIHPDYATR